MFSARHALCALCGLLLLLLGHVRIAQGQEPTRAYAGSATHPAHRESRSHDKATGQFRYKILNAAGQRIPGKLTFIGLRPTHKPGLGPREGTERGEDISAYNRLFSLSGEGVLPVPLGNYRVVVSRGPEWDTVERNITVSLAGAQLTAILHRVVDTRGWVAADLHVHGTTSTDSRVPIGARVAQLVADGVEFVASTDHNMITDYAPTIRRLGASHLLSSVPGDEITTKSWGHLGVFPLPTDAAHLGRTAVRSSRQTGIKLIDTVRAASPNAIVVAVHPHLRSSYLRSGGVRVRRNRARKGFSWRFDAIEVFNGYHRYNFGRSLMRNVDTWFQLLDNGHLVCALGSSDSHALRGLGGQGGYPRTYLRTDEDRPEMLTAGTMVDAIRSRRAIVTTGPFPVISVGDVGIGGVAPATEGKITLSIEVRAAPWVPVDRLTLFVNGVATERIAVPPSHAAIRLHTERTFEVARDAYVLVMVEGKGSLEPVAGEHGHPLPSLAFTNPIFIDADGNGRFAPPSAAQRRLRRKRKRKQSSNRRRTRQNRRRRTSK